jgi:DNA-binding transcriptional regulator YdaS (Cro superfamily)
MLKIDAAAQRRSPGLLKAIEVAGGLRLLARALGISAASLSEQRQIPAHRILQVEAVTKIKHQQLRPGLYEPSAPVRRVRSQTDPSGGRRKWAAAASESECHD